MAVIIIVDSLEFRLSYFVIPTIEIILYLKLTTTIDYYYILSNETLKVL